MEPFERVEIGQTGLTVPRLGLGGAPLGGLYESVPEEEARNAVDTAYRAGIRFYDTSPYYGHGRCEERFGRYLASHPRGDYVLSSKVGRVLIPCDRVSIEDNQFRDATGYNPVFDFTRDGVMRSFESSLERLRVDRLDIVHIHDPDAHYEQALLEAYQAVARLKEQGRVRAVGVGMNQWEALRDFARDADFDCLLVAGRYTLLDQSALAELMPLCSERGVSVIIGGPYNSGILATGSQRRTHFDYEPAAADMLEKTQRLEAVCARHGVPLKAAALQFPFGHPAVVAVIPGARSASEVEENVAMMSHPIPTDLWRELQGEGLLAADTPLPWWVESSDPHS